MSEILIPAAFQVDDLYSSAEIQHALSVGNAGGVRLSVNDTGTVKRMVVMTSDVSAKAARENPYHDRIEDSILVYTGAGLHGDQIVGGVNARIPQQLAAPFPIYGFTLVASRRNRSVGPKRWRFLGLLEYLRHYPETQVDAHGEPRRVWIFELRIHRRPPIVPVLEDVVISSQVIAQAQTLERASAEDREIVTSAGAGMKPFESDVAAEEVNEIQAVRSRLLALEPQRFEYLVHEVLLRTGFERVTVTKYRQDGGIDVNAYAGSQMWPLKNLLVQVQAKRWLHSVGRKEVAELRGSLQPFARGTVVTTSHFTRAAINEASEVGKNPIVLIDGYTLASIVRAAAVPL